jgi:hypothetical protein
MKKLIFVVLCFVSLGLSGCVSKGWQGLIPMKDARFRDVKITITTPWGSQTFEAKEIDTRLEPGGALPPLLTPTEQ